MKIRTKGKVRVEVGTFSPDLEKFIASVAWIKKNRYYKRSITAKRFPSKKAHNCSKAKG